MIEDLISTGGSSLKAAEALKDAGFEILGMVAIFTYGFIIAEENFAKAGIRLITLSDYESLISLCRERRIFSNQEIESLNEWRLSPDTWGI